MSILITGSGGIIGRHIVEKLRLLYKKSDIVLFEGDLADMSQTQSVIKNAGSIKSVIHLAAMVSVDAVKADPARAYSINVGGTVNLLGALAQSCQTPHVFHCSSAHVYEPKSNAISEEAETTPLSLYGRSKLLAEIAAKDICASYGMPLCIGRIFSIHDPCQKGPYLRPSVMKRLSQENLNIPFELPGADSIRDFLTAQEAAQLILSLTVAKYCGIINIGSGKPTPIRDFVQGFTTKKLDIRHTGKKNCLLADTTKLNTFLEKKNVS